MLLALEQRALDGNADKTPTSMVGTAGEHPFAGTVWSRNGTFRGEAHVFGGIAALHAGVYQVIEVVRIEAPEKRRAIALLIEKIEDKCGLLSAINYWPPRDTRP